MENKSFSIKKKIVKKNIKKENIDKKIVNGFSIGDIIAYYSRAGSNTNYTFFMVTGFTKSNNLRVDKLEHVTDTINAGVDLDHTYKLDSKNIKNLGSFGYMKWYPKLQKFKFSSDSYASAAEKFD